MHRMVRLYCVLTSGLHVMHAGICSKTPHTLFFGPIHIPYPKGLNCWFNPLEHHYFVHYMHPLMRF